MVITSFSVAFNDYHLKIISSSMTRQRFTVWKSQLIVTVVAYFSVASIMRSTNSAVHWCMRLLLKLSYFLKILLATTLFNTSWIWDCRGLTVKL